MVHHTTDIAALQLWPLCFRALVGLQVDVCITMYHTPANTPSLSTSYPPPLHVSAPTVPPAPRALTTLYLVVRL